MRENSTTWYPTSTTPMPSGHRSTSYAEVVAAMRERAEQQDQQSLPPALFDEVNADRDAFRLATDHSCVFGFHVGFVTMFFLITSALLFTLMMLDHESLWKLLFWIEEVWEWCHGYPTCRQAPC